MARALNFNPGPAALPLEALERAAREFVEYAGTGMSIMEHSHRGKAYEAVHNEAIALVRELLGVGDDFHVLLLQGGATGQFAMVPMNLLHPGKSADYTLTGSWAKGASSIQGGGHGAGGRQRRGRRQVPAHAAAGRALARPGRDLRAHHEQRDDRGHPVA
jgi:hypothetical protein